MGYQNFESGGRLENLFFHVFLPSDTEARNVKEIWEYFKRYAVVFWVRGVDDVGRASISKEAF